MSEGGRDDDERTAGLTTIGQHASRKCFQGVVGAWDL